jgi:hypothetical protein
VTFDPNSALELVMSAGDEWQSWRALRLAGDDPGELPSIPSQDALGAFTGTTGRPSPGATGSAICYLKMIGLSSSAPAVVAADWLIDARTPAQAWLDAPDDVPGVLDTAAAGRVWATAAATCGLLAVGRDPGHRAIDLLRGEADQFGRFTGGAYPTFAAAGAYWQAEGPKTEIAEWALRWARERLEEEVWDATELVDALILWSAAGIPSEHLTLEMFAETLRNSAPDESWPDDLELTLRTAEVLA